MKKDENIKWVATGLVSELNGCLVAFKEGLIGVMGEGNYMTLKNHVKYMNDALGKDQTNDR